MYKILMKRDLNDTTCMMDIEAPRVAAKAQTGQFVILRVNEEGERIPLTIAGWDKKTGAVKVIFQKVGKTTMLLGEKKEGEYISDFAGPLGKPTDFEGIKKAIVVGGGLGCAIAYPTSKALFDRGVEVDLIAGFKTKDIVILEDEMKAASTRLHLMTDDGSYGKKGFTTTELEEILSQDPNYDVVYTFGPPIMMKFVSQVTKKFGVKTIVSMNPIMIDGTGMCGGCRLTVGGETKFACVDGPDFDGHQVDWDEMMRRSAMYKEQETKATEAHKCRMEGMN
jgi:ferredoxin--NADP+ reductase